MMERAIILVFAVPLLGMAVSTLARRRRDVQRTVTAVTVAAMLGLALALVRATRDGVVLAARVGTWARDLAIVVAVDGLAALLLTVMLVMTAAAVVLAVLRDEDAHPLLHPLVLALVAGVALSLVTADLFNLFVAFEVMLVASYVLLTLRAGPAQVRAGVVYVSVNLLASTLFLLGVGLLYGVTGTVGLARLSEVIPGEPGALVALALVLVAVATKASLVPLHAWLPRTYVHASPAVTALFSGLLTKVGVYVLYRLSGLVLTDVSWWRPTIAVVAVLTMVVGVLGGLGGSDVRGILSYHMVSQLGYAVLPLAVMSPAIVTAGLLFLLQYVLVKGTLFLAAGAIEAVAGTGRLDRLGGLGRHVPWLVVGFAVPALALAGIPPTSGFVGKYLLVLAAFRADAPVLGGVAVAVSLLTLLSMVKIHNGVFWGEPTAAVTAGTATPPPRLRALVALPVALATMLLAIGIVAPAIVPLVADAAAGILDPSAYLDAVRSA